MSDNGKAFTINSKFDGLKDFIKTIHDP